MIKKAVRLALLAAVCAYLAIPVPVRRLVCARMLHRPLPTAQGAADRIRAGEGLAAIGDQSWRWWLQRDFPTF